MLDDPDALFIDIQTTMSMKWGTLKTRLEIPADTFREQLPKAVEMMQAHKDKKSSYCAPAAFVVKRPVPDET